VETDGLKAVVDDSFGPFTAVSVAGDAAHVANDGVGSAHLYESERDDVWILSSRAALAARARSGPRARPAKDPVGSAWLVYGVHPVGTRTGFEGVSLLPSGSVVTLRPGALPERRASIGWVGDRPDPAPELAEVAEEVESLIADELRAVHSLTDAACYMDLTGGKDSRMLLAVALRSGLAGQMTFQTAGPADARDVQIATELAERFDLSHEGGLILEEGRDTRPYPERADQFVRSTCGMVSLRSMRLPRWSTPRTRVSGTAAEVSRGMQSFDPPPTDLGALIGIARNGIGRRRVALLDPVVREQLRAEMAAIFTDLPDMHPYDRLGTYQILHKHRRFRGPLDELDTDFRVLAGFSLPVARAAYRLDPHLRQDGYLYATVMDRASPGLAAHRLTKRGWAPELADLVGPGAPTEVRVRPPGPDSDAPVSLDRLDGTSRHQGGGSPDQAAAIEMLRELVDHPSNAVWDFADRGLARRVLDLPNPPREVQGQLHGLLTAALWLSTD
jgi:hypothetical protein